MEKCLKITLQKSILEMSEIYLLLIILGGIFYSIILIILFIYIYKDIKNEKFTR